ncbi:unnamed protein product [Vitrella brassicaformis CCMP3155]|uniref:RING-type domain-containing protein n=2 Tax=Vitrella brassicaformis TaxID=1169539 RepID=A0A0G4H2Q1_VITBC|nr:unnamed protein product [Vitrella brassicaformis CCMP3155]|mmetsp:Transcript_5257/g.12398  ORF Transcript_5257/g.12398 Transcript_5257/m.12398 type:complete len:282 (+) Transcript_5257:438-1283(+)|eukprot:CEM37943.1 unnamed protein product [Vitrella brassicaformis CCMP3155]
MPRVHLSCNDGVLFFAFAYSSTEIILEWDKFATCYRPIQLWLVVSYLSILLFRAAHYLGQYLSDDGEEFLLYTQRGPPVWVSWMILGGLFPFFTAWTIVGTVWFAQLRAKTPNCLPRGSHPWFLMFWLGLCYIWIVIYLLFISVAVALDYRRRRAERDLRQVEDQDSLRRWGQLRIFVDYGIHLFRLRGLTPAQIERLPCSVVTAPQHEGCSICLEDLKEGETVRVLQQCGHVFHKSCIDIWLLRNAVCPLCKMSIPAVGTPLLDDNRGERSTTTAGDAQV